MHAKDLIIDGQPPTHKPAPTVNDVIQDALAESSHAATNDALRAAVRGANRHKEEVARRIFNRDHMQTNQASDAK